MNLRPPSDEKHPSDLQISKREVRETARHNPFSGWPVQGEPWNLGIKTDYQSGIGPGLACFVRPDLPLGVPLLDVNEAKKDNSLAQCPLGFYCPFLNVSNPDTWPVLCPADTYYHSCLVTNLLREYQLDTESNTAPTTIKLHANSPEGYYCPSGTITPHKCRIFSYCPVGSIGEVNYGFILLFLAIDAIVFAYLIMRKAHDYTKQGLPAFTVLPFYSRWNNKRGYRSALKQEHAPRATVTTIKQQQQQRTSEPSTLLGSDDLKKVARISVDPGIRISRSSTMGDGVVRLSMTHDLDTPFNTPRVFVMEPSTLDIDYPDVEGGAGDDLSSDLDGLGELDLISIVSNVSPLIEAFRAAFNGRENLRMNLKFNQLKYSLGEKVILEGISGEMQAGKMTAILGPSGAGKTSFMNVLMGKVARTSGQIAINGIPAEMHSFRKIIGYVPQDDIMLQELTVREVIHYSARTRLPRDWSGRQVDELVDSILKVLNLEHVAHMLIGDEVNRGISGGQRKRVNIAMELAAAPLTIFLDEPTSGLDSTAALKVAKILRSISRVGLTVVAIVHQPRIEIFNTFDNVLMIVPGGRTAYFGPVKRAQSYFENSLGFVFNRDSNPADVLMDILSGRGKMKHEGPSLRMDAIVKFWETTGREQIQSTRDNNSGSFRSIPAINSVCDEADVEAVRTMAEMVNTRGASFLQQLWNAHQRSITQQSRTFGHLAMEIWVGTLSGLIMGVAGRADEMYHGVLVPPYTQLSSNPNEWFLGLYGTLIGVAVAMAGGPAGVRLFGEERVIFWREAASGHNALAYYLGKNISAIYRVALSSLHFTGVYVFFSKPTFALEYQYALVFLNFFCIYGIAVVVSMSARRENASLLTVVLGLLCAIFDGFAPSLRDARKSGVDFLFTFFPNRWAAEAQYSLSLDIYSHLYDLRYATEYFGYELNKTGRNMLILVALALGYRILGFILLVSSHRDKQR
ncbi:hypothetical protein HDU81_009501 [Chytriomyces hyalinus]|nr:hypothetical protein HDU81_009501 [Chytriomyces hyalinus]